MKFKRNDIREYILAFEKKHDPYARYASFDYCYNYFHPTTGNDILMDMEKSCLSLGFYLSSWGMFRGSSFMLDKSSKNFESLIEYIALQNKDTWSVDVNNYTDENVDFLIEQYNDIRNIFIPKKTSHLTLVTKIMLGVFGSVPAYDRFFKATFSDIFQDQCGFTSFNKKSLRCLGDFFQHNRNTIEQLSNNRATLDFSTGNSTDKPYTNAKIVDMYGFTKALNRT
ncbi:hypothetical protein [Vibrio breoganii]|uniref:hypothetical protein n=1 Tax=Vibrio breoganii TaxID=553239 RepID=UPI000C845120|nr:hypothetical protein [Vibrio breoganii]PML10432.1 hypothetical protein BCT84_17370 [Vibrio breoganii]